MPQPTTCPNCNAPDIKIKTVKIDPNTGNRLSMIWTIVGGVLLAVGVAFVIVGVVNLPKADNQGQQIILIILLAALFLAPGLYLTYPWLKGEGEVLGECKCKQCKYQWRWMEGKEVFLLKAWLPGSLGTMSEVWMELGPEWFRLQTFDKKFHIKKSQAARQVEFLTTPHSGSGIYTNLKGMPMINVGRREGTIKGIVLESDGFQKLQQWVPPATAKDIRTITLRKELQGWGTSFIFIGVLQGISLSSGTSWYNPVWGGVLLIIGLLNMLFVNSLVLILDGIVIAIAGLLNLASGTSPWTFFGVLQLVWAGGLVWRFFQVNAAQAKPAKPVTAAPTPAAIPTAEQPELPPPSLDSIVQSPQPETADLLPGDRDDRPETE